MPIVILGVTPVNVTTAGGLQVPQGFTVTGTADSCAAVEVTSSCSGSSGVAMLPLPTATVINNSWTVQINNWFGCACGSTVTIHARCSPTFAAVVEPEWVVRDFVINCGDPGGLCPSVSGSFQSG